MLALGFLNPLLLWALPLAAVPIIIHLLNRRRFKRIPWAAMEYLLAAMKRNRRRLRMEHWILLALRTLAVLLLVFLVTRPQLAGGGLITARTHHVVCLDDSASMAQRGAAVTVYESAEERVEQLARRLSEVDEGDLFTLIRASQPDAPLLSAVRVGPELPTRVAEVLSGIRSSELVMDLGVLLAEARRRAGETEETGETDVYLVTDFRERDWLTDEGSARSEVVAQIMEMHPDEEHLTVFPLGPNDSENLAVVDVTRVDRLSIAGTEVKLGVTVTNLGLSPSAPTEIAIAVDDRGRIVRPVEEPLDPGESVEIQFEHTFHEPGFHGVVASLPADRYPIDDSRALALEVQAASRVLLVDGDPKDRPDEAETFFLSYALDPGGDTVSGIEVRVLAENGFESQALDDFNMVWLCNVRVPTPETVERLESFVAAGGGLVVFLGNQVEPFLYNEGFYKDGEGLLPMPLGEVSGDPDRPEAAFLADDTHPVVAELSEFFDLMFGARVVLLGRYITLDESATSGVSTIMRVANDRGSPLMVGHTFQNGGEVLLIATSADTHWSNWPTTTTFLPLTRLMHKHAAKAQDLSALNLTPGEVYRVNLDLGRYRPDVLVRELDESGDERTFTATAPEGSAESADVEVPMRDLSGLGLFGVLSQAHGGGSEERLFARNPPVAEGALQKLSQARFATTYPPDAASRVTIIEADAADTAVLAGEGELWRLLGFAMLGSLLLESLLAWRFGRR